MAWLAEWRRQRVHRQRAEHYVRSLPAHPEAAELAWATGLCGEPSRARSELGWLRWAVSRLVAERDAMDDRTAAEVVRVMEPLASGGADPAPGDPEGWPERWAQYAAAAGQRGTATRLPDRLAAVLLQIMIIDLVFSLDSIITAVGMVDDVRVMIAAVLSSVALMMVFAGPIGRFVSAHPTIKVLALSFLVVVGVVLIAEGFDSHVPKGYVYFAMAFSLGVEMLNIRMRKRSARVVHLHNAYEANPESSAQNKS